MAIPNKVRVRLANDPFMKFCIKAGSGECRGAVQWHHAWEYAGRQIQEWWAIVPLCHYHHKPGVLDNDYAQFIGLRRATYEELKKYHRIDWQQLRIYLLKKYAKTNKI